MYCSSCGVSVAQGLSYCNYCGAKLSGAKADGDDESTQLRPGLLVSAISVLFIFGLVAIGMLMGILKVILELPVEGVLAFASLPFLLLLVLEFVFIRLLLRGKRGADEGAAASSKVHATNELDAAHARALPEHMPSVTEHTTRAFDPIYTERKSK